MNRYIMKHGDFKCYISVSDVFQRCLKTIVAVFLWWAFSANATINVYEFDKPEQQEQFQALVTELRCPKCQNQNIADSDAGVAKLIKDRVYKLVKEGQSSTDITAHLIERYGEFVTYRPLMRGPNLLLWFGPLVILIVALLLLIRYVRRSKKTSIPLSSEEQAAVDNLVKRYSHDDD